MHTIRERPAICGGRPVRDTFLIFGSPRIEQEEIDEVIDCLRTGWLSTGPKVARFQQSFREYIGVKHALALNSCTAGLHLSLIAARIGPGDEVITTPMTFAATANTIIHAGATPVFVDINLPSMNIDPKEIERKITSRTKAIIPVHLAGRPCQMNDIMDIARRYNLVVIEDAAHAIEAVYKGKKVGTIADLTVFSFYVTKNITTGEGGIVTTNNDEYADAIQIYALHGMTKGAWKRYSDAGYKQYQIVLPGYKYNMMDMQAAIGIHQLKRAGEYLKIRERIWQRYNEAFVDLAIETPAAPEPETLHSRHLYTVLVDPSRLSIDRDGLLQALYSENIGSGIHFLALHLHPYYSRSLGLKRGDFPNAEHVSDRTISLPLSAKLTDQDVEDVVKAVRKVISYYTI